MTHTLKGSRQIYFRAWDGQKMHHFDLSDTIQPSLQNTIMQFTGLTDRNRKDIYEGDIIRLADVQSVIEWDDGGFQMRTSDNQGKSAAIQDRVKRFEIIGNIHQAPELL